MTSSEKSVATLKIIVDVSPSNAVVGFYRPPYGSEKKFFFAFLFWRGPCHFFRHGGHFFRYFFRSRGPATPFKCSPCLRVHKYDSYDSPHRWMASGDRWEGKKGSKWSKNCHFYSKNRVFSKAHPGRTLGPYPTLRSQGPMEVFSVFLGP